jgi:hypothetical protein
MQKVSYMGNGETTEFTFNFPYFDNSNVVVTKNGMQATGYNIIGTPGGLDADIPFVGGTVVFEVAPCSLDCIVIARQLPLARVADYQPLAQINPTTLNQDLNYLMEVIKDRKDELDDLIEKYTDIADKESTETLLARISAIHDEIVEIDAKITALGDVSQIRGDIATLDTRTNGLLDYVIESQTPSAENNYTWYRKYKSGWVEQGGIDVTSYVTFPITMADTHYTVNCGMEIPDSNVGNPTVSYMDKTTTGIRILLRWDGAGTTGERCWQVSGFAAA